MSESSGLRRARLGAKILKCYSHPLEWNDGDSTHKPHLRNSKVLHVTEIDLDKKPGKLSFGDTPATTPAKLRQARANAEAIRAWAAWVGLTTIEFQIDQQATASCIFVPNKSWHKVLQLLRTL